MTTMNGNLKRKPPVGAMLHVRMPGRCAYRFQTRWLSIASIWALTRENLFPVICEQEMRIHESIILLLATEEFSIL